MRCRFGLKRRFVATMEWLRLWPNEGFFPQIAQILDTAAESSSRRSLVDADHGRLCRLCRCGRLSGCASGCGAKLREDVGHLEGGAGRFGALVETLAGLLLGVGG
jgi:hypothetical protein